MRELGAGAPLPARCANPVLRDCSFYASCLERSHPCGADGHALGYGDRYCLYFPTP